MRDERNFKLNINIFEPLEGASSKALFFLPFNLSLQWQNSGPCLAAVGSSTQSPHGCFYRHSPTVNTEFIPHAQLSLSLFLCEIDVDLVMYEISGQNKKSTT